MNLYVLLGSRAGTSEAASLSERLAAWHDTMVAHERRLRVARPGDRCTDECPHVEARMLWEEAVTTFGDRASELRFLRSSAETHDAIAGPNGASHVATRDDDGSSHRSRPGREPRMPNTPAAEHAGRG
jgi:hypothetical protein